MNNFIEDGLAEIKDILDPVNKLKKIITLHLEKLGANRKLAMVFQIELRHTAKFMSEISRKTLKIYLNIIEEVIKDGQKQNLISKEINPKITTKVIFGAMDEMVTNWILSNKNYNLQDMSQPIINVILNGIAL
jgi:TetR/AcrR family fatty acid metabolism transcriptional regulator